MVDISAARLQDFLTGDVSKSIFDCRLEPASQRRSLREAKESSAGNRQRRRVGRQVIIGEIGERQRHCEWRTIDDRL